MIELYTSKEDDQVVADKLFFDKYLDHSWVDNAWMGLGNTKHIKVDNKLLRRTPEDIENPGLTMLKLMRDPEYLGFTAKTLLGWDLLPIQIVVLEEMWKRRFPMIIINRGGAKTTMLALYATLRCALYNGIKIVGVGASFRQSKLIFEKMEDIWNSSDILRSICDNNSGPRRENDRCTMKINDSRAIFCPIGTGEKIRGLRAQIILTDEMASVPPDIYETVITGFAAVTGNPFLSVKESSRRKAMQDLGIWTEDMEDRFSTKEGNQAIITGTAYYSFNHFYQYWSRYKKIIESKGDKNKLSQLLGGEVPPNFNWRDYSIVRIPFELMPENFMDEQIIARSKATVHSSIFLMEFSSCFPLDSDGFFKRSLIESCVTSDLKPIELGKSGRVIFEASLRGNPTKKYVYGVDPASEQDNFSIVILELNEDHTRIVNCWTTNRQNFKKRLALGATDEHDFYKFVARKIRDLMTVFPCERIAMDSQGGGVAVSEALQDPANLKQGEKPIFPTIDPDKEKDTDDKSGLHILDLCNFAKYEWVRDANHGLRKDLEDKALLFPRFDSISLGLAAERDADIRDGIKKTRGDKVLDFVDSLEDCIMEIEELKNEMATITVSVVGTGVSVRERWDVPEVKLPGNKKGRMRKDRYSALLMANMIARQIARTEMPIQYKVIGGFSRDLAGKKNKSERLYTGPEWFTAGGWEKNLGRCIIR